MLELCMIQETRREADMIIKELEMCSALSSIEVKREQDEALFEKIRAYEKRRKHEEER